MTEKMRATGKAIAWAAAGAIGATALTGIAFASASSPSAEPNQAAVQAGDGRGPDGMGPMGPGGRMGRHGDERPQGRVMHGELVVKDADGKAVTVAVQNGTVTAVDSDSLTVKSEDGYTKTWKLTADTKVHQGREAAKIADIKVGATVHVGSGDTGATDTAARVGIRPADAPDEPAAGTQSGSADADPALLTTA